MIVPGLLAIWSIGTSVRRNRISSGLAAPLRAACRQIGGGHHLHQHWAGFIFLAVVLGAFSRGIVGWSMSIDLRTKSFFML